MFTDEHDTHPRAKNLAFFASLALLGIMLGNFVIYGATDTAVKAHECYTVARYVLATGLLFAALVLLIIISYIADYCCQSYHHDNVFPYVTAFMAVWTTFLTAISIYAHLHLDDKCTSATTKLSTMALGDMLLCYVFFLPITMCAVVWLLYKYCDNLRRAQHASAVSGYLPVHNADGNSVSTLASSAFPMTVISRKSSDGSGGTPTAAASVGLFEDLSDHTPPLALSASRTIAPAIGTNTTSSAAAAAAIAAAQRDRPAASRAVVKTAGMGTLLHSLSQTNPADSPAKSTRSS